MTAGYDAVVFDMDGVVVEPTDGAVIRESILDTLAEFDLDEPPGDLVERLLAQAVPTDELATDHGVDPAAFWRRREANASTAQVAAVRRGDKRLYDDAERLGAIDAPLGLVSNNQAATVRYIHDRFELDAYFETAYGREPSLTGANRKKPDPYYIEQAMADIGAEDVLYVGDSNTDLRAAAAADLDAAFVRRPHRTDYDLVREPTVVVDSLAALVDWLEG